MSQTIFADGIVNGRVAFVTGGGTGITGGVARAFAEAGASVALVSRKMDHLQPAADAIKEKGGRAIAIACDVRSATVAAARVGGRTDLILVESRKGQSKSLAALRSAAKGARVPVIELPSELAAARLARTLAHLTA